MQRAKRATSQPTSISPSKPIAPLLVQLWDWLTLPTQPVYNEELRHRYRLLAGIMIVLFIGVALILIDAMFQTQAASFDDADFVSSLLGLSILFFLFAYLRRTQRVSTVAAAVIIIAALVTLVTPLLPGSRDTVLYFTVLPIVLTGMFFRARSLLVWLMLPVAMPLLIALLRALGVETPVANQFITNAVLFLMLTALITMTFVHEVRTLAERKNVHIQQANVALRQSELSLEQRVADRTRQLEVAREELERLYKEQFEIAEKLRAVDAMKSQFLASMSHELRTPLNAILNFTEFVSLGMLGDVNERQKDALDKALESGRHLLSLINDVLDITKIESGMMRLLVEPDVDVYAELNTVKATAESMIGAKSVRYVEDVDDDLPKLVGDRRRIRQILLNLVCNAVKFTEYGTITISVKRRGDDLLFAVNDTGPGIPLEEQQIIFQPFVQTGKGIKHHNGTGLGLPISNRLIEAHGGKLWLESSPGNGSAFYFTLPVRSDALLEQVYREEA